MSAAEVCDIMDFWAEADWPLTQDEVQRISADRFGWTIEVEDDTPYLMNTVSGMTFPDVMTIDSRGRMMYMTLDTSDTVAEPSPESAAALGDAFALMVREGETRWGKPAMRAGAKGSTSARWDLTGGARVTFTSQAKGLTAMFETPQGAEVERKLGN